MADRYEALKKQSARITSHRNRARYASYIPRGNVELQRIITRALRAAYEAGRRDERNENQGKV